MRVEGVSRSVLLTGLIVTLLASAAPLPAQEGREALERHIEWLGGAEAWRVVAGLRMSGTLAVAGLQGTLVVTVHRDGYQRTEYDLEVVEGVEAVTPEDAWEINPSGQVETMGADKAAVQRRGIGQAFQWHLLRRDDSEVSFPGAEEKDGREWEVVRFSYPDGDSLDLFLDPADGSCTWARRREDTETSWIRYGDWRRVDGLRVPFSQETIADSPMKNQSVTWTEVSILDAMKPATFRRPASDASPAHIRDASGSTPWISMDLFLDRYIYLPGKVNGVETEIVLDSGAGMTVLDEATAKRAGLVGAGALAAEGTGGEVAAALVDDVTLEIGGLTLSGISAAVIDLGDVHRQMGRDLPVILGKEVFHDVIVDIDYPNRRVAFRDPRRWSYGGEGTEVALLPADGGHKRIRMQVEDLPPAELDVDTGNGGDLVLFAAYAEENGILEDRRRISESLGGGVGGTTISKITTLSSVTFAGHVLENVPVTVSRADEGAFHTTRNAGNVGASIFGRFRIIFDYSGDRMLVEPGAGWDRPFRVNRTGIQARLVDRELDVRFVAPGSPAEAAGLKPGDRIVAVNGSKPGNDFWQGEYELFFGDEGTVLELELADGRSVPIELATYY